MIKAAPTTNLLDAATPPAHEMRRELVDLFLRDILGPAGGPEEEVAEGRIEERYLVGLLAPQKRRVAPEELDGIANGGTDSGEDGVAESGSPQVPTIFPSSFGLTFSVDTAVAALTITARWGQYEWTEIRLTGNGDPKRVWKRTPIETRLAAVPLQEGKLGPIRLCKDDRDVHLQGVIRPARDGLRIITLFLVNGQQEPRQKRGAAWLFQPELIVEAPDGAAVFGRHSPAATQGRKDTAEFAEDQSMEMIYRRHRELAVGHGVSVHWDVDGERPDRARRIRTVAVPTFEVPRTEAPTAAEVPRLTEVELDMKVLGTCPRDALGTKLSGLATAYSEWIEAQRKRLETEPDLDTFKQAGKAALKRCAEARDRIQAGIDLLLADAGAADAFQFMNQAMVLQRVRTLFAERVRRGQQPKLEDVERPEHHRWYPFQLAFILLNLPGVTQLDHPERRTDASAIADLLWFPTGGGKTEAYLGLTAYTVGLRRLKGTVEGRSGESGIAVLMRYTLRVLTLQQFQRAATLICACEHLRREARAKGDERWGLTPIRIGIWVGKKTTPNTTEQSSEAVKLSRGHWSQGRAAGSGTPHQLTACPWCGTAIHAGMHLRVVSRAQGEGRTFMYCGDVLGRCPFSAAASPGEGIPVLVVDEEIYRLLPAVLIATIDKFAQMPWNGMTQMLFGQVDRRCERHGFRSPEIEDEDSHKARAGFPAAKTVPHPPLRPPDLIIQDELHLISGPLGTLTGLYETAVDHLATWTVGGRRVRPKVIASTATVRRARDQVHNVFLREVRVFPPHGLDAEDNFFSVQRSPASTPGRFYIGLCAPGKRMTTALVRVYAAFLSVAQRLYERYGAAADPWMTLVGYFNSLRELGGTRRLVDDHVRQRLTRMDERGLARRGIQLDTVAELTSRCSATDIPNILDRVEVPFDPTREAKRKQLVQERRFKELPAKPMDVLLATNMISVGVDIKRLGLMTVLSQPKTTAEYIQATSRVGRSFPGIVCTLYNWARPRDLSHYETFEHYHATFYKHVEALSITPFAPRAIDRGLAALLVSLVRLAGPDLNENAAAGRVTSRHPLVKAAVDAIVRRAELVAGQPTRKRVEAELAERVDEWHFRAGSVSGGSVLGYRDQSDGKTIGLLRVPGLGAWDDFTCLNSLRDVEPPVGLILHEAVSDAVPVDQTEDAPPDSPPDATPEESSE